MESTESECVVTGTLSFVLYMSSIVGLAPLKFERVPNGFKIRTSKAMHVYGILLVFTFSTFASLSLYAALVIVPKTFHMRHTLDRVVGVFTMMLLLPVGIVGAVTGMKRMCSLITYMAQVEKINKELTQCHKVEKPKEWRMFVGVVFMLLFGNFTIFSDYGIYMYRVIREEGHGLCVPDEYVWRRRKPPLLVKPMGRTNLLQEAPLTRAIRTLNLIAAEIDLFHCTKIGWLSLNIFYYIMIAIMQMIGIQFCLISYNVLISFQLLTTSLKKLLKRVQDNTSHMQFNRNDELMSDQKYKNGILRVDEGFLQHLPRNATTNMRRLAELYCSLCDVVRIVSDSHGTLLVQLLMALLLYLILAPYHLIIILFYSPTDELYTALPEASWVLFHASILLMIVEPCHQTHEEIAVAKKLISHLMRFTPPSQNAFSMELQNFYRHLILNDVIYTPLGMFSLSRGLIMTILGSITTYLVVIVSL